MRGGGGILKQLIRKGEIGKSLDIKQLSRKIKREILKQLSRNIQREILKQLREKKYKGGNFKTVEQKK